MITRDLFTKRVRAVMALKNISNEELAKRLDVQKNSLLKIMTQQERPPTPRSVRRYAQALDVPVPYLL
ncbi:MAG: helix-turn-helix domain-containing protein, partial [Aeromonas sp.]